MRRRGFVLPTTLLVMTLLTVMLTAAFTLVSAEFRTTDNSWAIRRAYAIAQAGLQSYMGSVGTITTTTVADTVTFSDGHAIIFGQRLVPASGGAPATWVLRSTGTLTTGTLTGLAAAQRTVSVLAQLNLASLPTPAAFVAANPVVIVGNGNNPIDGDDGCGINDQPGLVAPGNSSPWYTASPGSGPRNGIQSLGSTTAVLDYTHIDWTSLLAGNFTPDYVVPNWPASFADYPVGINYGDLTLGAGTRQGILVVTGNLTLTGGRWAGILIVGGRLIHESPSAQVQGMIVTGLNLFSVGSVGSDTLTRGSRSLEWHSCHAGSAIAALNGFSPIPGTWSDTWSVY